MRSRRPPQARSWSSSTVHWPTCRRRSSCCLLIRPMHNCMHACNKHNKSPQNSSRPSLHPLSTRLTCHPRPPFSPLRFLTHMLPRMPSFDDASAQSAHFHPTLRPPLILYIVSTPL